MSSPATDPALFLPGAAAVIEWFGHWPSFHDGEILELHLNRSSVSSLRIHTWNMTDKVRRAGDKEYFVLEKHAVVTFLFERIADLELADFSGQNVINGLDIEKAEDGFLLKLWPCYGLAGFIKAAQVQVRLTPGAPSQL